MGQDEFIYQKTTHSIRVLVNPFFLEEDSAPDDEFYIWACQIRIENWGDQTLQLMRRSWHITDGYGQVQIIEGEGVVGEQPLFYPGDSFEYTSSVPLQSPTGFMKGIYDFEDEDGNVLKIEIPCFSLDSPYLVAAVN